MMKKIIKFVYILFILLAILATIYLIVNPMQKEVTEILYDSSEEIFFAKYKNEVKEKIHISHEKVFRIMIFLNEENIYDNLNISLLDNNNEEVFSLFVPKYQSNAMYFEFNQLNKDNDYFLVITDTDGDEIELATVKSNEKTQLLNDATKSLQTAIYYYKNANNYLWYPIFLFTLLFTFYPFVWGDDNIEEK